MYTAVLESHRVRCSSSRPGYCWDKAVAESWGWCASEARVAADECHTIGYTWPSHSRRPSPRCIHRFPEPDGLAALGFDK